MTSKRKNSRFYLVDEEADVGGVRFIRDEEGELAEAEPKRRAVNDKDETAVLDEFYADQDLDADLPGFVVSDDDVEDSASSVSSRISPDSSLDGVAALKQMVKRLRRGECNDVTPVVVESKESQEPVVTVPVRGTVQPSQVHNVPETLFRVHDAADEYYESCYRQLDDLRREFTWWINLHRSFPEDDSIFERCHVIEYEISSLLHQDLGDRPNRGPPPIDLSGLNPSIILACERDDEEYVREEAEKLEVERQKYIKLWRILNDRWRSEHPLVPSPDPDTDDENNGDEAMFAAAAGNIPKKKKKSPWRTKADAKNKLLRKFSLTFYGTDGLEDRLHTLFEPLFGDWWIIWQVEKSPDGRPHLQVDGHLKVRKSQKHLYFLDKIFGEHYDLRDIDKRYHIEPQKGTNAQNMRYCSMEFYPPADDDFWEYHSITATQAPGLRKRWEGPKLIVGPFGNMRAPPPEDIFETTKAYAKALRDCATAGQDPTEAHLKFDYLRLRYSGPDKLFSDLLINEARERRRAMWDEFQKGGRGTIVIHLKGSAGGGKSDFVELLVPDPRNRYLVTYNKGNTQYYDRYNLQEFIWFDNWSGQIDFDDAMNMFDPKQLRNMDFTVWVKGASVMFCARVYILCSVGGLKTFRGWQNLRDRFPEWKRRVLRMNVDHIPPQAKRDTNSAWQFVYECWDRFSEANKIEQARQRATSAVNALTSRKNPLNKQRARLTRLAAQNAPAAVAQSANRGTPASLPLQMHLRSAGPIAARPPP